MPTPILPTEIIDAIIADVAMDSHRRARSKALLACCLVSKTFLSSAQAALYERLELGTVPRDDWSEVDHFDGGIISTSDQEVITAASKALDINLLLHPHLGPLIKSLFLNGSAFRTPWLFAVVLTCSDNLEHLQLARHLYEDLTRSIDTVIRARPELKKLSLALSRPMDEAAIRALSNLTALEHLVVRTNWGAFVEAGVDVALPFRLRYLSLDASEPQSIPEAVSYFAQSSATSLQSLRLIQLDTAYPDLSPFTNLGHISIRLIMRTSRYRAEEASTVAQSLAFCLAGAGPQVHRVTLTTRDDLQPGDNDKFRSAIVLRLLPLLPPSLETLDISAHHFATRALLEFIHSSTFSRLRRLSVCTLNPESCDANFSEVVEAGAAMGIIVEVMPFRIRK